MKERRHWDRRKTENPANRAYLMIYVRTNSSASSKGQARSLVVRSLDHELGGQATLVSSWFNLSEDLESKYVMEVLSTEV